MKFVRATLVTFAAMSALVACDSAKKQPAPTPASEPSAAPAPAVPAPLAPTGAPESITFTSDKSKLGFVASKVTGKEEGAFDKFSGSMRLPGGKPEGGSIEMQINLGSLKIEPEKLAEHLKSADFFDIARYPMASFKSTEVKAGGAKGGTHTVTGNLTLHGKEKPISFPVTIAMTDTELAAKSEFTINRKDFDIVYPGVPNDLIRDAVTIKFDVHGPRVVAAQAQNAVQPN